MRLFIGLVLVVVGHAIRDEGVPMAGVVNFAPVQAMPPPMAGGFHYPPIQMLPPPMAGGVHYAPIQVRYNQPIRVYMQNNAPIAQPYLAPALEQSPAVVWNTTEVDRWPFIDRTTMRQVGEGSFGIVSVATTTEPCPGGVVAVKEIKPGSDQAEAEKEADLQATLDNRHVLRVYDYAHGRSGGLSILMEAVAGGELLDHISDGQAVDVTKREVWFISMALQTLQGIEYLHARSPGVVHRDIKPENIMVTRGTCRKDIGNCCVSKPWECYVKVIDFGLSCSFGVGTPKPCMEGETLGTPTYMSPEVWVEGKSAQPAADSWALGVTFFKLWHGAGLEPMGQPMVDAMPKSAPPNFDNVVGVLRAYRERRLSLLFWDNFPQFAQELVKNLMNADANQRWTVHDARTYLVKEALARGHGKGLAALEAGLNELGSESVGGCVAEHVGQQQPQPQPISGNSDICEGWASRGYFPKYCEKGTRIDGREVLSTCPHHCGR